MKPVPGKFFFSGFHKSKLVPLECAVYLLFFKLKAFIKIDFTDIVDGSGNICSLVFRGSPFDLCFIVELVYKLEEEFLACCHICSSSSFTFSSLFTSKASFKTACI